MSILMGKTNIATHWILIKLKKSFQHVQLKVNVILFGRMLINGDLNFLSFKISYVIGIRGFEF